MTLAFLAGLLPTPAVSPARAISTSSEFTITTADLAHILQQITIAEAHAKREPAPRSLGVVVPATPLLGVGPNDILDPTLPWGLRTVDGSNNNLMPGRATAGAADTLFPRLTTPEWRDGVRSFNVQTRTTGDLTTYAPSPASIVDAEPRVISNLIADQTVRNPAAVAASGSENPPTVPSYGYGPASIEILNTPSLGGIPPITSPYNSLFTFFGQFFDHGLDLIGKKSTSFVALPLPADDDLIDATGGRPMLLNRTDFSYDSNVQLTSGINRTTPWVDQNQTYSSAGSKQVFLREYTTGANGAILSTGRLLTGQGDAIATWGQVKAQALTLLGIRLADTDIGSVPLILTDEYGRFLRGPRGLPQLVLQNGSVIEASTGTPVTTAGVAGTGHAFLDDIAHNAVPVGRTGLPLNPDADATAGSTVASMSSGDYDNELLEAHYVTGDGRGNENFGLTALHTVFHAEHNRLRADINRIIQGLAANDPLRVGFELSTGWGYGERLFQAARFVNEMEYQHLVFDTFVRRLEPAVRIFAGYDPQVDPSVTSEFANAVYRFGHSMLNEKIARARSNGDDDSLDLFTAFLNPAAFQTGYPNALSAAGAVARGSVLQTGNEIDEFVTGALRNNLVGTPLDLASLNLARGRDTGTPSLNNVRNQLWRRTESGALAPYVTWEDFGRRLRHRASLVNFVAAYGTHPSIAGASSDRRLAAYKLVNGTDLAGNPLADGDLVTFADREAFMNGTGAWARAVDEFGYPVTGPDGLLVPSPTGLDDIDLWIGGLAETRGSFGGLLGSTFTWIFKTQMESLQDGDRLYYLSRLAGMGLLTQIESNTLADIFVRNTDVTNLPFDLFSAPAKVIDVATATNGDGVSVTSTSTGTSVTYSGGKNAVIAGTEGADRVRSSSGNDTIRGFGGADVLDGDEGSDNIQGGAGNDVILDSGVTGIDLVRGGSGRDYINSGPGIDAVDGGDDNDFLRADADGPAMTGGLGNDLVYGGFGNDLLDGGDGADWVEGATGNDGLTGDAIVPALGLDISAAGPDVLVGQNGADAFAGGGGDDIFGGGDQADRATWADTVIGDTGFDWMTYSTGRFTATKTGVIGDLRFTAPIPGNPIHLTMDLFLGGDVEGLSGGPGPDQLLGDDRLTHLNPFGQGDELTAAGRALVDTAATPVLAARLSRNAIDTNLANGVDGNIILGGGGSDVITGRLGNDLIDGDAWLDVWLETQCGTVNNAWVRRTLAEIRPLVQAGTLNGTCTADKVRIGRRVMAGAAGSDIDVAAYQFPRSSYMIRRTTAANNQNYWVVEGPEGTDVLWNIERLQFPDALVNIAGQTTINAVADATDPLLVIAIPSSGGATVKWSLPLIPGGGLITGYTARARDANNVIVSTCQSAGLAPSTRTCPIGRLIDGAPYTIDVVATNSRGPGLTSPPVDVVPGPGTRTVPGAPTSVAATSVDGQATVTWNQPTNVGGGGMTIIGYTARVWATQTGGTLPVFTCVTALDPTCVVAGPLSPYGFSPFGAYYVDVIATNELGDGAPSSRVLIRTVPTEPQNVRLTSLGSTSATVAWDIPAGNGGGTSTISGYAVSAVDPNGSATTRSCTTTTALTCQLTSLVQGTTYLVSVRATNTVGTGPASNPLSVTPQPSPPAAPTIGTATPGDQQVTVTWTAPLDNGGSEVTSYTAVVTSTSIATLGSIGCDVPASQLNCQIVGGLVNGVTYQVVVHARNAMGAGAASASRSFTPAKVPGAPATVDATAGNGSVVVSWTAPTDNGGSAVTGYDAQITASDGTTQIGNTCSTTTQVSCSFAGLTNGVSYRARVRAKNPIGNGTWSSLVSFSPQATVPQAPTGVGTTRSVSAGTVTVNWTALTTAQNGGSPVGRYIVTAFDATTNGNVVASRSALGASASTTTFTAGDLAGQMGTSIFFEVAAENAIGLSAPSTRASAVPDLLPNAPGTPSVATRTQTSIQVQWTAPTSNGGSALTGYTARAWARTSGGSMTTSCTSAGGTLTCLLSGLRRGTTYYIDVGATNLAGTTYTATRTALATAP